MNEDFEVLDIHFNLSLDLLCIVGFDGYFKHLNASWTKALGYSLDELYRMPWIELIHPDDLEQVKATAERLYLGQDIVNFENRCLAKDGSMRWLLWTAKAAPEEQLIYAVAHDITERRAIEDKVFQLNEDLERRIFELEKANEHLELLKEKLVYARDQALQAARLKSEFVANISHEIRTPLASVIGMTELLLSSSLSPEQRTLASTASDAAQSLLAIINDILDFSKIEAGKLDLQRIDFNLPKLIQIGQDLFVAMAQQKHLELKVSIDPDIPESLQGDPLRVRQILLNLLSNAVKFTERGQVNVSVSLEGEDDENVVVCVAVQDTGIGLSSSVKRQLFEPFVQANGTATREYGGTGLGLSICKRLVELMGGEIGAESAEGRGSTFWFTLPLKKARSGKETSLPIQKVDEAYARLNYVRASADSGTGNSPILLVEDSPVLQDLALRQLKKLGFQADLASNGKEAVEAAEKRKYDLIFLDVQMPIMDGYETTRTIREHEIKSGMHTPIVAMTAGAMSDDKQKCLEAGMDDYLSKPVTISDLYRIIDCFILGNKQALQVPAQANCQTNSLENSEDIDLSSLIELYGQDGIGEILSSFFAEANSLFDEISQTLARKDGRNTTRLAHQLKGLAGVIPENALANLAKELKESAEQGEWSKCPDIQRALELRFRHLQLALAEYLP